MDYLEFLKQKQKNVIKSGFDVNDSDLNSNLFDFQKFIVKSLLTFEASPIKYWADM